uniref:Uncharacterized protein n=1 Tax=Anguilla anguilla TaxID=7936 RepID=A0A0E9XII1_ANGAN
MCASTQMYKVLKIYLYFGQLAFHNFLFVPKSSPGLTNALCIDESTISCSSSTCKPIPPFS